MNEAAEWILRNIQSCTFPFQLDCCYTLVILFKARYEDDALQTDFIGEYNRLRTALMEKDTFLNV